MSIYTIGLGLDVDAELMLPLDPQPRSSGVQATARLFTPLGVVEQGPYVELVWTALEGPTAYRDLLAQFGLTNVLRANVTVNVPDPIRNWVRYSGVAIRPVVGQEVRWEYLPRNVTILVRDLTLAPVVGGGPEIP